MKKTILIICYLLFVSSVLFAQSVGIGTTTPHASAQLDITSSTRGLLLPRMTTTSINLIGNPAKGLLIYDSTINQLVINIGTTAARNWQPVTYGSWSLSGNSGTNPEIHFIGTTDLASLRFRVHNRSAGYVDSLRASTFLGYRAGNNFDGIENTAIGFKSMNHNMSGESNTAVGAYALQDNISGHYNVAMGYLALSANINGTGNSAVGYLAMNLNSTGSDNCAVGSQSLRSNTTGDNNTATGYQSLVSNIEGNYNSAFGALSLALNQSGSYNVASGSAALYNNITGHDNAAYGAYTHYSNTTGYSNAALGAYSLFYNTTGYNNSAVGFSALYGNKTGYYNTAIGDGSLHANTAGVGNTASGSGALYSTINSSYNTMLGYHAGFVSELGWSNTFIGADCNATAPNIYNSIALGAAVSINASNQVRIGNTATTSIGGFAGWTTFSDGRFKRSIREEVQGLDFIMKLRPITYQLDITSINKKLNESATQSIDENMRLAMMEKEKMIQSGFIAQEVEQAAKETGYDFSGVDKPKNEKDFYGLRYAEFVAPLVKAVQQQQRMIVDLQKLNAELERRIVILERK